MQNKLFIIGTPIGNLDDISLRALQTLKEVDLVLCEDTRVTLKLLSHFDIRVKTESLHQHTTDDKMQKIIERIEKGEKMALVTDAGTPGISDPGGKFVALAVKANIEVVPIPGASAVITALSVCGFPTDTFTFLGFPPQKKGRQTFFSNLDLLEDTIVFYESKHRITKTLEQVPQERVMMLGRELTKMHETLYRGTAKEIVKQLETTSAKGEFVIVLAPKSWH